MAVKAGELRHCITIQYNAALGQTDENSFSAEDWRPLCSKSLYAKKDGLKGRLFYQAAAAQAEDDIMFTIRYLEGIKAGMRVIEGSETFEVKVSPIDVDGLRQWLEVHTRQVLQNGG
ncbi:phage head closure protein [Desulfosporosinus sp. PR]|uniref:phage head closure protein n=1 Tax=Candidatus Desulfosporosinus nitrosoreducens TaxID=3401928 RepID=UPI0027F74273|nr:phage head closure protein [Desulfosporosinus sp. PR]MDQ7095946.1 phage head closure protein [Desulfosporosinus sp. PR]